MSVTFKSDAIIERGLAVDGGEKSTLESVAGGSASPLEAKEVWPQVLEHKWYMSERLGRDVGLKVAALDYFENICKVTKRDQLLDLPPPTLPFMRPLGYR